MFRLCRALPSLVLAGGLAFADAAYAGVCAAPLPEPGAVLKGPVLHVEDSDTLCIAQGFEPSKWVPLKVGDGAGAVSKSALMAAAFGKDAVCTVSSIADGQATATCTIEERPLAALLQQPGVLKASGNWR